MAAEIVPKPRKWPRIRCWGLVGGVLGLLFTLAVVAFAYLAPNEVDSLFILDLEIIVSCPTLVICRVFGWNILTTEPGHQGKALEQVLVVSIVNCLLFA